MLNLYELEQLIAFADEGTLSTAAKKLHISQPTITRTMQKLEEDFGVSLFIRGKNRIALNDTGKKAAEQARKVLQTAEQAIKAVQDYDKGRHTIAVGSCAPAPLWYILPALSGAYPEMTISSSIKDSSVILEELRSGVCQLGIFPEAVELEQGVSIPFLSEHLSICVPPSHDLAQKSALSFAELNGFNFLLRSEIGFWDGMCRRKMPSSRFLVQKDAFEFAELVRSTSLPCFTTDLAEDPDNLLSGRVTIPVTDPEANVTYYMACLSKNKVYGEAIGRRVHFQKAKKAFTVYEG